VRSPWRLGAVLLLEGALITGAVAAPSTAADQGAVVAALDASAAAWSRNDLHAFMQVYDNSPSTSYVTNTGLITGYNAIQAMYAARFGGAGAGGLGQLSFSVLAYRPLGPGFALLTGRFVLHRAASHTPDATGVFTLVFHKSAGAWGIVSDHTS